MFRSFVVAAVLLCFTVPATAVAQTPSPSGGAPVASVPAVGNVNAYYGQLKDQGLFGSDVTAVSKTDRTWQPCAVKVCGGYVAVRHHGQNLLVLSAPHRDQIVSGGFGYAASNGLTVNYFSYDDHVRHVSLRTIPFTRRVTVDGQTYTFHLAYAQVQLYDPSRPFPQGCNYTGCGPTTMK